MQENWQYCDYPSLSYDRACQLIRWTLEWLENESYEEAQTRAKCTEIGFSDDELELLGYGYLVEEVDE